MSENLGDTEESPVDAAQVRKNALGYIGVGAAIFAFCSIVQAMGGSSMFEQTFSTPDSLILELLMQLTWWPGWLATIWCVGTGALGLYYKPDGAQTKVAAEPAVADGQVANAASDLVDQSSGPAVALAGETDSSRSIASGTEPGVAWLKVLISSHPVLAYVGLLQSAAALLSTTLGLPNTPAHVLAAAATSALSVVSIVQKRTELQWAAAGSGLALSGWGFGSLWETIGSLEYYPGTYVLTIVLLAASQALTVVIIGLCVHQFFQESQPRSPGLDPLVAAVGGAALILSIAALFTGFESSVFTNLPRAASFYFLGGLLCVAAFYVHKQLGAAFTAAWALTQLIMSWADTYRLPLYLGFDGAVTLSILSMMAMGGLSAFVLLGSQTPLVEANPRIASELAASQTSRVQKPGGEEGWHLDPSGRNTHRYHDGESWTENVANAGVSGLDPWVEPSPIPPPPPAPALPTPKPAPASASPTPPTSNVPSTAVSTHAVNEDLQVTRPRLAHLIAGSNAGDTVLKPTPSVVQQLTMDDGSIIEVSKPTLVGRNPTQPAGRPALDLLRITDASGTVSKSHAILIVSDTKVSVEDLGSVNGTYALLPEGNRVQVSPGHPQVFERGIILEIGDRTISTERR